MIPTGSDRTACGCCAGDPAGFPTPPVNGPGLAALEYRLGTHGSFFNAMLAGLSQQSALSDLTTRDPGDPAIALVDAWAMVLDVLTFYQERIANEGYLRTAGERRSLLELARAVGYEPSPGVAASTYLAFELETGVGAPDQVAVPIGTQVQSLPGPGETPQTFETVEEIEVRPGWNRLGAQRTEARPPTLGDREIHLAGVTTGLKKGDPILIVGEEREVSAGSERWDLRFLSSVAPNLELGITKVAWETPLGWKQAGRKVEPARVGLKVFAMTRRAGVFGHNAPDWLAMPPALRSSYQEAYPRHGGSARQEWPAFEIYTPGSTDTIDLDTVQPEVTVGSWLVLAAGQEHELYRAVTVAEKARANFTLTAKTTRVKLEGENLSFFANNVRDTTVFIQGPRFELAEVPVPDPVQGDSVPLAKVVEGLKPGRRLLVTGQPAQVAVADAEYQLVFEPSGGGPGVKLQPGEILRLAAPWKPAAGAARSWAAMDRAGRSGTVTASPEQLLAVSPPAADPPLAEAAVIDRVDSDGVRSTLRLKAPLANSYDRASFGISANVAAATHGQTRNEVLGSGDASRAFQGFVLKQEPLTYVRAPAGNGSRSTLEVRVDRVAWSEAPSYYGLQPRDRAYVVRIADDGKVSVLFGDGVNGSRLTTGVENVSASYRAGIGEAGMVKAGQLSLLMTRPLGVKGVSNPLPAEGGADPDLPQEIRANTPLTAVTFGRVVSLTDFEDFARAYAGIAKARAAWLWSGHSRLVQVTVAGPTGQAVAAGSEAMVGLVAALGSAGAERVRFQVDGFAPLTFEVAAGIYIDADYQWEDVSERIGAALGAAFAFAVRDFAQPVTESEAVAVIQRVEGVVGVELTRLALAGGSGVAALLPALPARLQAGAGKPTVLAAQLLTIDPTGPALSRRTRA